MHQAGSNSICLPFVQGCLFAKKTLLCLTKTCHCHFNLPCFLETLKDSWPIKHNFIIFPQIISFVLLWPYILCTDSENDVCVCACMYERALRTSCFALWSNMGFVSTLFPACMIQLSSQLGSQTGSPTGVSCGKSALPLCAHKRCHSVKLPSSSKGYRVIRYTGEINSSAPEKSRNQLPHLPVRISHSLPLWWGIM